MAAFVDNPTIKPTVAFAWELEQTDLRGIDSRLPRSSGENPYAILQNEAYIKPVNDGVPGQKDRIHLVAAAGFVLDQAFAKDPHTFNANLPGVGLEFQGCMLPDNTLFDVLGWILSVTSVPPANATDRNYYLPLLALFARWCRILGQKIENTPPMVHISWFKGKDNQMAVLLGSTIGPIVPPLRPAVVERERQKEMYDAGFESQKGQLVKFTPGDPPKNVPGEENPKGPLKVRGGKNVDGVFVPDPLAGGKTEGVENGTGFGICAETFFYLVARHVGKGVINEQTVKGLALRPRAMNLKKVFTEPTFQTLDTWDEKVAAKALANPCPNSCQLLIPQLGTIDGDQAWDWRKIFSVSKLQEEIAPGSSQAAAAPPTVAASGSGQSGAVKEGPAKAKASTTTGAGKKVPSLGGALLGVAATAAPALFGGPVKPK